MTQEAAVKKEREVYAVELQDGRTVEFAGKRKMLKETIIDGTEVKIRLDFRNGETRTFVIPDDLLLKFAGHGAEQKLGDETAGVEDVDDMVLGVDELIARLNNGEWGARRESSGLAGTSILMRALIEYSGKDAADVKAFLSTKSQAEKLALRMSAQLKPIVDKLEAEKSAKANKVDTEALLESL